MRMRLQEGYGARKARKQTPRLKPAGAAEHQEAYHELSTSMHTPREDLGYYRPRATSGDGVIGESISDDVLHHLLPIHTRIRHHALVMCLGQHRVLRRGVVHHGRAVRHSLLRDMLLESSVVMDRLKLHMGVLLLLLLLLSKHRIGHALLVLMLKLRRASLGLLLLVVLASHFGLVTLSIACRFTRVILRACEPSVCISAPNNLTGLQHFGAQLTHLAFHTLAEQVIVLIRVPISFINVDEGIQVTIHLVESGFVVFCVGVAAVLVHELGEQTLCAQGPATER